MHAEEYHRPDYNEMLSVVYGLMSKYDVDKLITALRTAVDNDGTLDKESTSYNDIV